MELNCPGKELALSRAKDLSPETFRRLVATRVRRRRIAPQQPPIADEKERRSLEASLEHLEKIDQSPDFLPIAYLSEGARRSKAVCRISTPSGMGTGFLIAKGVLMTNNHVLPSSMIASGSIAEFNLEDGTTPLAAKLNPSELFLTDKELDFTVVACNATDLTGIDPIPLSRDPSSITRNERAAIIQHPAGRNKEVALHNSEVIRIKDMVIHYRTDTEPGSSGSPVFNNRWELVALHHAGWIEQDGRATNEGIRVPAIVARLEQMGFRSGSREKLREVMDNVQGVSPLLGFFETAGLSNSLEIVVDTITGTREFADVGYWNIEHFNNQVHGSRVARVGDVCQRLLMDAVGLVEVENGALDRLIVDLGERGLSYDYKSVDAPGSQDLAILYDRETTAVRLRPDLLDRFDTAQMLQARTATGSAAFPRKPLLAEVSVQPEVGEDPLVFLMLVVHLKAFGDAESRARRKLAAAVLEQMVASLRDDEELPVVLGGDFNDLITADSLAPLRNSPDLFSMTLDDATGSDRDAITFIGQNHRSLIDHIVVSGDVKPGLIMGDDAAIVRLDRTIRDFSRDVSDHVPVVFRMVFRSTPVEILPSRDLVSGAAAPVVQPRSGRDLVAGKRRRDYASSSRGNGSGKNG